jgi:hypothetical protein
MSPDEVDSISRSQPNRVFRMAASYPASILNHNHGALESRPVQWKAFTGD